MPDLQTLPAYKLSAVLAETGLRADTVRVWEKRYGLPRPQRSAGGHRLYSRRDIRTLQWLQSRQAEGLRISQAVQRWRELEARHVDPLTPPSGTPSPLDTVRSDWLLACLDFNEPRAESLLDLALAAHGPEALCLNVLQRGLHAIGEMWYRGEASVQQEHFTAELAMRRLHRLLSQAPSPNRDGLLLVGTPSGEQHAFPPLLLAVLLRLHGWDVRLLGVNVPLLELEHALRLIRPVAVLLAVQRLDCTPSLQETARMLQAADIPLGFGGGVFLRHPSLRERISGFFLGETFPEGLQAVGSLLQAPSRPGPAPEENPAFREVADSLLPAFSGIEAQVRRNLPHIPAETLHSALRYTRKQWLAALLLGDLTPLHAEAQWLAGLPDFRQIEPTFLDSYWQTWVQAVGDHLGPPASPILDRIRQLNPA